MEVYFFRTAPPPHLHGKQGPGLQGGDPIAHLNTCGQQSGLWLPISRPTLRMASMHRTWAVCSHTPCSFPICSSFCSTFSFTAPERHSLQYRPSKGDRRGVRMEGKERTPTAATTHLPVPRRPGSSTPGALLVRSQPQWRQPRAQLPRAAFPSGCLAAKTKRWAEGIRGIPRPLPVRRGRTTGPSRPPRRGSGA